MKPHFTIRGIALAVLGCMLMTGAFAQRSQRINGDTRNQFFRSMDFVQYHPGITYLGGGQTGEIGASSWDASIVLHDNCGLFVTGEEYGPQFSYQLFRKVREFRSSDLFFSPAQAGYVGVGFSEENGNRDGFVVTADHALTSYTPGNPGGYYLYDVAGQNDEFLCVTEVSGGGFVAAGYASPYSGSADKDILVVRFLADLSIAWEVSIGLPSGDEEAWGIVELPSGNVLIAGGTESYSANGFRSPYIGEIDINTGAVVGPGTTNNLSVYQYIPLVGDPLVDSYFLDVENGPNNSIILTGVHISGNPYRVLVDKVDLNTAPNPFTFTGFGNPSLSALGTGVVYNAVTDQYTVTGYGNGNNFPLGNYDGFALTLANTLIYNAGVVFGGTGADFSFDVDVDANGLLAFGARNGSFAGAGVSTMSNYLLISDNRGITDCHELDWVPDQFYPRYSVSQVGQSTSRPGLQILNNINSTTSALSEKIECTTTCKRGVSDPVIEEQYAVETELSVSPNPASDRIQVRFENAALVRVMDLSGRVLWQQAVSDAGTQSLNLDVRDFAQGIYIAELRLRTGEVHCIKWVKK